MRLPIILFLASLLASRLLAAPSGHAPPTNLAGEWAVEWEEGRGAKRKTEIIYIWFSHDGTVLGGKAMDPNLLPANISGEIKGAKLSFRVDPDDGDGWAAAPTSTFKGRIIDDHTMEGTWRVGFSTGGWKAWRTGATKPSVAVTVKTLVTVRLTSEEYDSLFHELSDDPRSSVYRPLTAAEEDRKQAKRVGTLFEEQRQIGELGGWLYYYELSNDTVRFFPSSHGVAVKKRICEKIIQALNANGYPWTKPPD